MLSTIILDKPPAAREALICGTRAVMWEDLNSQARQMLAGFASFKSRRIGLCVRATAACYAALAALDRIGADTFLFDGRMSIEQVLPRASRLKLGAILIPSSTSDDDGFQVHQLPDEHEWSGSSTVTILTSGSTGEPKASRHTWGTLTRPVRKVSEQVGPRWLLTYRPNLYAGLQVMLQCFVNRGTLVIPPDDIDPHDLAQFMSDTKVQYVSATPSFWRRLLILSDTQTLRSVPLLQITLGGEIIDEPLLNGLKNHFPGVRLAHIYATTELGRCFSVHDGLAGFPSSYLDRVLPDGCELRIRDGELLVRSTNSMKMYDPLSGQNDAGGDWFSTGDLVNLKDDRVHFVGRRTEIINVAGYKVHPTEVEQIIRVVPGVFDVRVFGKRSSLAGQLVACEIVPAPHEDPEALRVRVNEICRSKLSNPQVPRIIKFVDRICLSAAGKTIRN